jgi:dihydrofolate reductase
MGKIVSTFFMSLDGVVEAPDQWHFDFFNDEMGASVQGGTDRCSAYLMGRVLYEQWVEHWPAQPDDEGFGPFINTVDKYVLSNTLAEATWDPTTILSGDDVAAQVRALKDRTDGDIGMFGSQTTVRWLLGEGLLDELHLLVHPVFVGTGDTLFHAGSPKVPLRLLDSQTFATGVLDLHYAVA